MSTLIKRCTKITSKRKLKLLSFASLRSLRKIFLLWHHEKPITSNSSAYSSTTLHPVFSSFLQEI
jgi:predicted membrane protein